MAFSRAQAIAYTIIMGNKQNKTMNSFLYSLLLVARTELHVLYTGRGRGVGGTVR